MTTEPKRTSKSNALLAAGLTAVLALIAIWWWVRGTGPGPLGAAVGAAHPAGAAVIVAVTAAWIFARFLRWQFLLRRAGVQVPIRPTLSVYIAGLAGTATPAYVGELVRGVFLQRRFGVPFWQASAVLVLERLLDVAALGTLTLVASSSRWRLLIGVAAWSVALLGVWMLTTWMQRRGIKPEAVARMRRLSSLVPALVASHLIWGLAAVLLPVAAAATGTALPLLDGVGVYASSTLIGAATLLPAGIGFGGSAQILELQRLGIQLPGAVAAVTLLRLLTTGFALALGAVFLWRELRVSSAQTVAASPEHFDQIASEYNAQWSTHVWDLLLNRKLDLMGSYLPPVQQSGVGLDLGCGLGIQVDAMTRRGYAVVGMDPSVGLLKAGPARGQTLLAGDALRLPFKDDSFDYAYAIGVLHHMPTRDAQRVAYAEILRVLKPGGVFLVHESNPRNPLFKFYMGYLFPLLKTIDEGTEWWLDPSQGLAPPGFDHADVRYFTFLPDFTPKALMRPALAFERMLERGPTRSWSAHYMAVLRKRGVAGAGTTV